MKKQPTVLTWKSVEACQTQESLKYFLAILILICLMPVTAKALKPGPRSDRFLLHALILNLLAIFLIKAV